MSLSVEELRIFLTKAKKSGYASGGESVISKEADGSKSTRFAEGDFKFHDNYFGGEPAGGREVVWHKEKPYWMMVYYGSCEYDPKTLIPVLIQALSNPPEEMPVRGPRSFISGDFEYKNSWQGDLLNFSGEEYITHLGKRVFWHKYIGGLVDQEEG